MIKRKELDDKFLREVDSFVKKGLDRENLGVFELFYEIVALLVAKDTLMPFEIYEKFIEKEELVKDSIELYASFHNSIIIIRSQRL